MQLQVICADPVSDDDSPPELDTDDLCDGTDVHIGPGELPGLPVGPSEEPFDASCAGGLHDHMHSQPDCLH